jgi:hypothetical protein
VEAETFQGKRWRTSVIYRSKKLVKAKDHKFRWSSGDGVSGFCSREVGNNTQSVVECASSAGFVVLGIMLRAFVLRERIARMGMRHQEDWRCRKCFFDDVTSEMVFVTCQLEEE